jgi:hypothetical protein
MESLQSVTQHSGAPAIGDTYDYMTSKTRTDYVIHSELASQQLLEAQSA